MNDFAKSSFLCTNARGMAGLYPAPYYGKARLCLKHLLSAGFSQIRPDGRCDRTGRPPGKGGRCFRGGRSLCGDVCVDIRQKGRYNIFQSNLSLYAAVVKSADTRDLKSLAGNSIPVQVRSAAPNQSTNFDTKTAFRFGGLFLRLCPEPLYSCGFRVFLFWRQATRWPHILAGSMDNRWESPKVSVPA